MTLQVEPTHEQIDFWIENYVPQKDFFFVEENSLSTLKGYLNEVMVIPRAEFFDHSSYNQIQFVNSYMYWTLSNRIDYIIVAKGSWITELPLHLRKRILEVQLEMGTGLTIPASLLQSTGIIPAEYIVKRNNNINKYFNGNITAHEKEFIVFRSSMWNELPRMVQANIVKAYAMKIDEWTCNNIPEKTPTHLKAYANTFSTVAGSNCLASTLFAITGEAWILDEWVHPETFLKGLFINNYYMVDDDIQEGDVVTWINSNNIIQHASYHIENDVYFNKSGQTFFEPLKITQFEQINRTWEDYEINVYRKK